MFGLFKKKKDKAHVLGAPAKGKAVSLKEVSDPTFSEGILGDGVAVIPSEGKIYAPADGTIGMVFDTLHAISLTTDFGAEVLIHVGLDTVQLKGEGFEGHVKAGDTVEIKESCKSSDRYKAILESTAGRLVPEWLESDQENLKGVVKELPTREMIDVPVNEMLIVELYSK